MKTRVEIMNDFLAINVGMNETFQKIVERAGSGMVFGCRDGQCGTCIVDIELGNDYLNEKTEKEKEVLKKFPEAGPKSRLACQIHVEKPNGIVRMKYK